MTAKAALDIPQLLQKIQALATTGLKNKPRWLCALMLFQQSLNKSARSRRLRCLLLLCTNCLPVLRWVVSAGSSPVPPCAVVQGLAQVIPECCLQ